MKIGILTFHYAYNFGAVWQCYGLQQTLNRLGYNDVEVLNVVPHKWHWFLMGIPLEISFQSFGKGLQKLKHWRESKMPFDEFRNKYIKCSLPTPMKEIGHFSQKYDAIIVGSDQVWAPSQRKDFLYFLNWKPTFNGKRIAYAPCCATDIIDEKYKTILQKALNNFDYLSARNISTQKFVYNLINQKVPLVPDPTILANYTSFINKKNNVTPYILNFILGRDIEGGNKEALRILQALHPECKIISVVVPKSNPIIPILGDEIRYNVSPIEWLNLIAHAKLVYTDSFHCTIFSMKFHTPFVAYYSDPIKKSRFEDLCMRFGVTEHIVRSLDELKKAALLPYAEVDNIFVEQQKIGEQYLREALSI